MKKVAAVDLDIDRVADVRDVAPGSIRKRGWCDQAFWNSRSLAPAPSARGRTR